MRFTIRELIWLTLLAALICVRYTDQADYRDRLQYVERLAHKIDADVHDHLKEVTTRMVVLEGWADARDRDRQDDAQLLQRLESDLVNLRIELDRLQAPAGPAPTKTQPRPR